MCGCERANKLGYAFVSILANQGDPYAVLGVAKTADKEVIIKAYRELARKWHPDKNRGRDDAEAAFATIAQVHYPVAVVLYLYANAQIHCLWIWRQHTHLPLSGPGLRGADGRREARDPRQARSQWAASITRWCARICALACYVIDVYLIQHAYIHLRTRR